ncbi:unnamed protein product [Notodromas monacha]|uniref:Assembly chaperone of rpl4 n=1 Tax=Notodromas monacha TaxID=399045 RepID=A0A7R9BLW0_9CRUS|nr:unnamed protein product [Notodromas monacha]CAG0916401.1 unnamed protein product [Notodromas monacha]
MAPTKKRDKHRSSNKNVQSRVRTDEACVVAQKAVVDEVKAAVRGSPNASASEKYVRKSKSRGDPPSTAALLKKVNECLDAFQYELAKKFSQRSVESDPNNLEALEMHAVVLTECGDVDGAKVFYEKTIALKPDEGYSKYLGHAQLVDGIESLNSYSKAILLMEKALADIDDSSENSDEDDREEGENLSGTQLKTQLSSAHCSIAELFMTDLCDEPEAEGECKKHINQAIERDPKNPEGYQLMASFCLVKADVDLARDFMTKSLNLWLDEQKVTVSGAACAKSDPVLMCSLPRSTRFSSAKLCIELDMWKEAIQILDVLIEEGDEDADAWYLLGYVYYLRGEKFFKKARTYFQKVIELCKKNGESDSDLLENVTQLCEEIGVTAAGESDDEDDEDWESADEESSDSDLDEALREMDLENCES